MYKIENYYGSLTAICEEEDCGCYTSTRIEPEATASGHLNNQGWLLNSLSYMEIEGVTYVAQTWATEQEFCSKHLD